MLAMADQHGRVWASIPGLANRAQVSLANTEIALNRFLAPDQYSRTPDNEGRRIEIIDGGWRLLNHAKYRALRDQEHRKEYKREWIRKERAKKKEVDKSVDNGGQIRPQYTQAEAEADINNMSKSDDLDFCVFWSLYPKKSAKKKAFQIWKRLSTKDRQKIISDLADRFTNVDLQYVPLPTTYLNGERWNDEKENESIPVEFI